VRIHPLSRILIQHVILKEIIIKMYINHAVSMSDSDGVWDNIGGIFYSNLSTVMIDICSDGTDPTAGFSATYVITSDCPSM
jgi:hypothetical protein